MKRPAIDAHISRRNDEEGKEACVIMKQLLQSGDQERDATSYSYEYRAALDVFLQNTWSNPNVADSKKIRWRIFQAIFCSSNDRLLEIYFGLFTAFAAWLRLSYLNQGRQIL